MSTINIAKRWLAMMAVVISLTACETSSSVEYNIHNVTTDTVIVTFFKSMMSSPYQGYDIIENDSVTTHYQADSCNIARVGPNQHLTIHKQWSGLYREDELIHAWRYIQSIHKGDVEVPAQQWDNQSAWHHRSQGGGNFEKNESHYYDLWFR